MAAPASSPNACKPPERRAHETIVTRLNRFWDRVTEGQALDQLWTQFKTEARSSYRFYNRDIDRDALDGMTRWQRFRNTFGQFFWAVLMKLSPVRRLIVLVGLFMLVLPGSPSSEYSYPGWSLYGGVFVLLVLVMELADRITMKRDLQIAREIQSWLVPSAPPQLPRIDLAFATRPANTVAGDYYDIIPWYAPNGDASAAHQLIVVADVAGKSMPAALLMATLQASLRSLANTTRSLLDLVAGVNRYACAHSSGGQRFTTAFLADFNPATCALTYVNCGHNFPILRRVNGALERLEAGGLPMGILESAPYQQAATIVSPGDLLVIFTDGVVEAENERAAEYGESRLLANVCNRNGSAQEMLNCIMTDVEAFVAGAPQHDDITCLVARFR